MTADAGADGSTVAAVRLVVPTAEDMRALGVRLAGLLRAGDLVLLSGELGAGKTTLAQGLGAGLGVRGPVTSPTFVIARVHPPVGASVGPPLVHVDAYRLTSWDELEDLDLETTLDLAVTVVEWGTGLAEGLADDRLEVTLERSQGEASSDGDVRTVEVTGVGKRWVDVDVAGALL